MALLSVAQLLSPIGRAEWRSKGVAILTSLGQQAQRWLAGSVGSTLLTYSSIIFEELSSQLSNAIGSQWLPTAVDAGLQLLSLYFYGVTPPVATFATTDLVLVNSGGGVYPFGAGQAIFQSTVANADGVFPTYTNVAAFTLNALQTLTVTVQCTIAGTAGNAPPNAITGLVTAMLGVTATNPAPAIGIDPLSDDDLRALDQASIAAHSVFGPAGAYAFAIGTAKNAVTGQPVNINRSQISTGSHTGQTTVVICGPDGTTDPNDLAGVVTNIKLVALPEGITLVVIPATPVPYSPTLTAYVQAPQGTSAAALQAAIRSALADFMGSKKNPIGGLTAFDPNTGAIFTGLQLATINGQIAQAVAAAFQGAFVMSVQATGTSDLALIDGQVATDAITVATPIVSFGGS